jgi:hypothetical protein
MKVSVHVGWLLSTITCTDPDVATRGIVEEFGATCSRAPDARPALYAAANRVIMTADRAVAHLHT